MLAPVYQQFTEGFQTRSLKMAGQLLAELTPQRSCSLAAK
jgi:hypothetical protein